jgi:hypothetical protein
MSIYALMEREELIRTLEQMSNLVKELYTHPVKELTTEEICEIYREVYGFRPLDKYAHDFANAILRKAQEK